MEWHKEGYDIDEQQINKTIMSGIKTAAITTVGTVSEPFGQYQTLYHDLTLDNGDKINIGKKALQKAGWNVTYQIIGDLGQHEFTKAKSVSAQIQSTEQSHASAQQPQKTTQAYVPQADPRQESIEKQVCLKEAINYHAHNGYITEEKHKETCDTARLFYAELFNNSIS